MQRKDSQKFKEIIDKFSVKNDFKYEIISLNLTTHLKSSYHMYNQKVHQQAIVNKPLPLKLQLHCDLFSMNYLFTLKHPLLHNLPHQIHHAASISYRRKKLCTPKHSLGSEFNVL